jgi:DNA-binding MarR family transcriptional regulator
VPARLPLPTLLSQVLVAFTIEFDNEFEHRMPHRTTTGPAAGSGRGPWATSMVMWSNFMQYVPDDGIRLSDLDGAARLTNLKGLERWGYIVIADQVVRPTRAARNAQAVWRPLAAEIEARWRERFGADTIARLDAALASIVDRLDVELPEYLPVVGYDMFTRIPEKLPTKLPAASPEPQLYTLVARALLGFTLDFEHEAKVSLPMGANVLRVLGADGVRVRDLPYAAGVSKEAIAMVLKFLERRDYVVIERDPAEPRTKLARPTDRGRGAQDAHHRLLGDIEQRWEKRFGRGTVADLRAPLGDLVGEPTADHSPLFGGLTPYPDGWRASVRRPQTLPHHPMVLHRGGYPDGS